MRIDESLNLVVPINHANGQTYWVHSTPISAEVFENFYDPIARTFTKLWQTGIGVTASPRIAYFAMRDLCIQNGTWEGPQGIEELFCNEVWRLTNVLMPTDKGWNMVPFSDLMRRDTFTKRELSEVQNILIFFTVNFCMHKQQVLRLIMSMSQNTWDARVTLLNCTAFRDSLAISTVAASTWRDGKNIVSMLLDWAANEGFEEVSYKYGAKWTTAQHYRQRHLLSALAPIQAIVKMLQGG